MNLSNGKIKSHLAAVLNIDSSTLYNQLPHYWQPSAQPATTKVTDPCMQVPCLSSAGSVLCTT